MVISLRWYSRFPSETGLTVSIDLVGTPKESCTWVSRVSRVIMYAWSKQLVKECGKIGPLGLVCDSTFSEGMECKECSSSNDLPL